MLREQLINALNELLTPQQLKDYCPNGLQVEGTTNIKKIVTGVTASQALIDRAIDMNADAILVHHGYFWKSETQVITGIKKNRIKALLENDINLIAYHLPIDVHPVLGNNAQLGKLLGLQNIAGLLGITPGNIVMAGSFDIPKSHDDLVLSLSNTFQRNVVSVGNKSSISTLAWCTGGGQGFIDEVVGKLHNGKPIDAFISGEISEQTTHSAREQSIDYFSVGHHASERYGVKAVGEWLADNHALDVMFVDIDNPA
ncbi:Nif3-like dinuclear metal center hexameric protein [Agaribacter marinus]|uniref:GTP cyclohydrolase 1 type 2 homolog n=1 Tax=Agaribacter marinus TaxID=1431249 RepID=A0AA37SWV1_9ALTE|nr:Nif3-like dinuclear metal center hexameric protein [Agaribacter marinus]GLR69615.1 GTP cyclohydrolase 1 type 2 [Agaribacter marinus]